LFSKKFIVSPARCLYQLSEMKTYAACCPFSKEIRSEVVLALRRGVSDRWAN
jgi:hypothetical protein